MSRSFVERSTTHDTMASATTTQTALCIIPPEHLWEQIQAIRSVHDKAYPRWMPHINLIYPFVAEANFTHAREQLAPLVNRMKPFTVRFDQSSVTYFSQKGDGCTYHLHPTADAELIELQRVIDAQMNPASKKKRPFAAHLTLGQTTASAVSNVLAEIKAKWTPVEFQVDRVFMISRENNPENLFTVKDEILLLGAAPAMSSTGTS